MRSTGSVANSGRPGFDHRAHVGIDDQRVAKFRPGAHAGRLFQRGDRTRAGAVDIKDDDLGLGRTSRHAGEQQRKGSLHDRSPEDASSLAVWRSSARVIGHCRDNAVNARCGARGSCGP
jgi:hypothetical protein